MRRWRVPYALNREDAERLCAILLRFGSSRSLRELDRRQRVARRIVDAAAAVGIIRIEKRKPPTGRPAVFVVLSPDWENKCEAAQLPSRSEQPRSLSIREEMFLRNYARKFGSRHLGVRGTGSAADAYQKAYRRSRSVSRSADSRLARQPWIRAAFGITRGLMAIGIAQLRSPVDMRSAAWEWWELVRTLNRLGDWLPDICRVIRDAQTYREAVNGLMKLDRFHSVPAGGRTAQRGGSDARNGRRCGTGSLAPEGY